ncbi:2'-5' RNA ligase family protein [Patescibacteria group bacterium]|nr:2'-5' RNA ligase family protein [Patescibacteria group bacterium]
MKNKIFLRNKNNPIPEFNDLSLNFWISPPLKEKISEIAQLLREKFPNQDYVPQDMYHCTVKSCGLLRKQIQESVIPDVIKKTKEALVGFQPFEVELKGFSQFPNNIFVQVFSPDDKLFELHKRLNNAIPFSEYPEFEGNNYMPHVAVIYFYEEPTELFETIKKNYQEISFGKMLVSQINIIKGGLPPDGHRVDVLETFKLGI